MGCVGGLPLRPGQGAGRSRGHHHLLGTERGSRTADSRAAGRRRHLSAGQKPRRMRRAAGADPAVRALPPTASRAVGGRSLRGLPAARPPPLRPRGCPEAGAFSAACPPAGTEPSALAQESLPQAAAGRTGPRSPPPQGREGRVCLTDTFKDRKAQRRIAPSKTEKSFCFCYALYSLYVISGQFFWSVVVVVPPHPSAFFYNFKV